MWNGFERESRMTCSEFSLAFKRRSILCDVGVDYLSPLTFQASTVSSILEKERISSALKYCNVWSWGWKFGQDEWRNFDAIYHRGDFWLLCCLSLAFSHCRALFDYTAGEFFLLSQLFCSMLCMIRCLWCLWRWSGRFVGAGRGCHSNFEQGRESRDRRWLVERRGQRESRHVYGGPYGSDGKELGYFPSNMIRFSSIRFS